MSELTVGKWREGSVSKGVWSDWLDRPYPDTPMRPMRFADVLRDDKAVGVLVECPPNGNRYWAEIFFSGGVNITLRAKTRADAEAEFRVAISDPFVAQAIAQSQTQSPAAD